MADNELGQEKTEQATGKRREEAREKGQVAKSREIPSVAVLFACLIYFHFNAAGLLQKIMAIMSSSFRTAGQVVISMDNAHSLLIGYIFKVFFMLLPLLGLICLVAVAANVLQIGMLFSASAIQPELSKLNPLNGLKNLLSLKSGVELIKNIIKLGIVGFVAYSVIGDEFKNCLTLAEQSIWGILIYIGKVCFKILVTTCWVLVLLAILDYLYQRWEYEKGLKMSRQEVKDEFKNTEGNPAIKARIKRLQREMFRKRMMAAVPTADVVITNPTHLAVALKYEQEKGAPCVVAKGAGLIAEKIREIARENNVPIVEDKPLAQVLYKLVQIEDLIPENLYRSVAEVLAYVYSLRHK
jgi:flagellar biosynthetic protein FlhB